jgi:hypothetical protein
MRILYIFPEPLPLPRARGIQVAHTVTALAQQGVTVQLAYVPSRDGADPLAAYGVERPETVTLVPLSRGLSAPFSWLPLHSNRLFFRRLCSWLTGGGVRHDHGAASQDRARTAASFSDIPMLRGA